ncbi:MAG: hypothetical protein IPM77_04445 [Crocinitomicaceae bacterium]|nr:hypothetical protein [Crocinitomicaceae bacterium]
MKNLLPLLILFSFSFGSCLKDKTKPFDQSACTVVISYSLDITPIIHTSCMTNLGAGTGCHDAWITDYELVKNYLDLGIWQDEVLHKKTMPEIPNNFGIDSLSSDEYQTMKCWIQQGYPQN